jgi:hypothetical protein
MLGEELIVQIEAAEDHADLRHVVVVGGVKRIVENGNIGRGIQKPEILQPAGAVNVRQRL